MRIILDELAKDGKIKPFLEELEKGLFPALINGVCDNAIPALSVAICKRLEKKALFVVHDEKNAQQLKKRLEAYLPRVLVFPARSIMYDVVDSTSREWERERVAVLDRLQSDDWDAVITVPDALMQYTLPQSALEKSAFDINSGDVFDVSELVDGLQRLGYVRAEVVEGAGQYALRGGILDVFPSGEPYPVRIDFFGDEVDLIGHFDTVSQRRNDNIQSVRILPATEMLYDETGLAKVLEYINNRLKHHEGLSGQTLQTLNKEKDAIENLGTVLTPDKYRRLLFNSDSSLFDYIDDALIINLESKRVNERARAYYWEQTQSLERLTDLGLSDFDTASCGMSDNDFKYKASNRSLVFDAFLNVGATGSYKSYLNLDTKQNNSADVNISILAEELETLTSAGQKVLYIAANKASYNNALSVLNERGIKAIPFKGELTAGVVAVVEKGEGLINGFEMPGAGLAVVAEETAAVKKKTRRSTPIGFKGEQIHSYADLSVGDYVVHVNHGIGVFQGLHNLTTDGVTRDYIKISYAAGDSLYVPAGNLDVVSKFIGNAETVKLSRLGGADWDRAKARAKASAKNIAKELLQLYSARKKNIAFPCYPDDELQDEFEATFEYAETDGQLAAINDIKQDMEQSVPMERLLCGDVGFGKTEVALRAVFKAVNSGKQAAILVPTTILAWQHLQTMKSRFRGFPVNVGMLSRFNDKRINDAIVADLKLGKLDVVVGTHKLLQKNIGFKDLGLLIIDEEQRFGVTHKERIKNLAQSVHTLTLSATPIPRTLNMALSGIKDMSVLEEAPTNRLPVQSYVLEHDDEIIFEAIAKELRRGGQVFYLINKIDALYGIASAISKRFPDKNVAIGHGQMDKDDLSAIWEAMVKGEVDILVCTTIIETGIDVPNANTLIIEDADRMGLSQLHQIRGRVGRSSRRAYAYFTYRAGKLLSEIARKRLQAIKEYTEFGSGFKIAMRDLEIRGAGNLLGAEQHGHIESVGYDLYIRLLQEAVDEEKGVVKPHKTECNVDLRVNAYIPEEYVQTASMRIDLYKKIALASTDEDRDDIYDELIDRFGDIPKEVIALIDVSLLRHRASSLGFYSVEQKDGMLSLYTNRLDINACSILSLLTEYKGRIVTGGGAKPRLSLRTKGGEDVLKTLLTIIDRYSKLLENV